MLACRCSRRLCAVAFSSLQPHRKPLNPCLRTLQRSIVSGRQQATDMPQAAASQAAAGEHKHTNRLAKEQSPYLLQHAHNPVSEALASPAVLLQTVLVPRH